MGVLSDAQANARVRRAVLEQVAYHPRLENLPKLLPLMAAVPEDDPALQHSLRVALRNHLSLPGSFAELEKAKIPSSAELLTIVRAVDTGESAAWLMHWLKEQKEAPKDLSEMLVAIARRLPVEHQGNFTTLLRERFVKEGASPVELLRALSEGATVQGGKRDPKLVAWAGEVAADLLQQVEGSKESAWRLVS